MNIVFERVSRKVISVLLIACLVCGTGAMAASAASVQLSVPGYAQERSNWCWAAAARMAGIYKYWTSSVTQTQIVANVKGAVTNTTATAAETAAAINYVTNNTYPATCSAGTFTLAKIQTSINNDYPVVPLVYASLSGHFYVIYGYNNSTLLLKDPASGGNKTCTYTQFLNGTSGFDSRPYYHTTYFRNYNS